MGVTLVGLLTFSAFIVTIDSHGMMLDPPNRSSLWRFNDSFPINYDDNENFCGGYGVQWDLNNGKCGVCGDPYGDPVPRKNENTGTYGLGYIVATYPSGSVIDVNIRLTANHLGKFKYSLCKIEDNSKPETEDCFTNLTFENGEEWFNVYSGQFSISNRINLPPTFKCSHCTLRWYYKTGNRWGICEDGQGALGCGPQETFWSCSDISKLVIKKWSGTRDNWMRYAKKMKEYQSGSGAKSASKYKFYEQMLFLNKIVCHRPTESNLPLAENESIPNTEENEVPKVTVSKKRKKKDTENDMERKISALVDSFEKENNSRIM
ncbi:hypothetical protein RN001_000781 [Aquatica leii]|uniref:Chitin-binding type-4 domain-containing protein n=1 Tax=Aquatica leii TaxID=1421715 RepID=A0AAN7Q9X9_9COLE|nr:hypothetical protein RN001_000781 [Aquatica leii]